MTFSAPLCFEPWLRPMPWGGTKLAPMLGLPPAKSPVGEAWLVSDHALHQSRVTTGPFEGQTLQQLIARDSEATVGLSPSTRFPLLIKILDAQQNLSVQVHPDDALAARWAPKEGGKTEAWTVLSTEPEAAIYLGLKPGIDLATFKSELAVGNAPLCLQRYQPSPGQTYFIPAGTVHALGQGVVVLEVQQTSDATFRLYDWGRTGSDGKPRELHLEAGLACSKLAPEGAGLQPASRNDVGVETLVKTPFFTLRRWQQCSQIQVEAPAILIAMNGSMRYAQNDSTISAGKACLVPASMAKASFTLEPQTVVYEIRWQ